MAKCNGKILHSLKAKFVLEEEEKLSATFVEQFLSLLERAEGTLLLAYVDVEQFEENTRILTSKLESGQKVYCIDYQKTIGQYSCAEQIINFMAIGIDPIRFTLYYESYLSSPEYTGSFF